MPLRNKSNQEIERHIRGVASDSSRVFITQHAQDRMGQRRVTDIEVIECLRRGSIQRPPKLNRATGDLKCRMEHFGPSRNIAVVVALNDLDPDLIVVTVISRTR